MYKIVNKATFIVAEAIKANIKISIKLINTTSLSYGMTEYDEFELLKRSGAKLPTDNYEFVEG